MSLKIWVPLISRRVKAKFSRKKSDPLLPQIRLNFAKFNRNAFVSSFLDFALVSLHLTALSLTGQFLENPHSELPAATIPHRSRTNAVYSRPRYTQINISPKWTKIHRVWYQWKALNAKRIATGDDRSQRLTTGDKDWWRVTTGENRWRRVRRGSNAWRRVRTGDKEW